MQVRLRRACPVKVLYFYGRHGVLTCAYSPVTIPVMKHDEVTDDDRPVEDHQVVLDADTSNDGPDEDPFDSRFMNPEEVLAERKRRQERSRRSISYACSECERVVGRGNLKVKRVQFKEMGFGGPVVRTHTVGWLCIVPAEDGGPSCLDLDPDWTAGNARSKKARA